ncbi:MAG: T9SS type A sorting domain-containing protein [Crocinitomicaceae bacterium]
MKNLYLVLLFVLSTISLQAQFVTITDTAFVTFLHNNYPACMNGNQMDTTCSGITNTTLVNCSDKGILDLEGLQYFDNLFLVNASSNDLTNLPALTQPSLVNITVNYNNLTTIPALPPNLLVLNIRRNPNLSSIPVLPLSLTSYYGGETPNLPMPTFHAGLETIWVPDSDLSAMPTLPNTVTNFNISNNENLNVIASNSLPPSLTTLGVNNCGLSVLPVLPPNLENLSCGFNDISSYGTLPATLKDLYISYCPNITQLVNLPDSMTKIQASDCNINYIDALPLHVSSFINLSNNQLTSIPNFPDGIGLIDLDDNNISSIPDFPSTLNTLRMENNNMSCWPVFPNLSSVQIQGNPFQCIPNYVIGMTVWTFLDTMPICNFANSTTNPQGCPTGEGIDGNLFEDIALDCNYAGAETPIKNTQIKLYDAGGTLLETTSSGQSGRYFLSTSNNGTYDVIVDTVNKPFTNSCVFPGVDSLVTISATDSLIEEVDFGFVCNPGFDLGVLGINTDGWVFPGQAHSLTVSAGDLSQWYGLNCAAGTSGSVAITVIGPVSYIGAPASALTPAVSGSTYTYTISDFGNVSLHQDFKLNFETDTTAQAGDSICVTVLVTPLTGDVNPINNNYTSCYEVINSYDPNDKQVYPTIVEPGYDDWLTYTIRFQNTGTAPAFNIRLEDTLSSLLDYETFEVIGYKHSNSYNLINDRLIIYFPNIMLPDSTTNEPASKGFFQYRIKPILGLQNGTEIENKAYIFFDYNDPIITNTAITSYKINDLSVGNVLSNRFMVFPNPSTGQFYLKMDGEYEVNAIEAYDMMGKLIPVTYDKNSNLTEIRVMNDTKGLCFINVITDQGIISKKMFIE